MPAGVPAAAVTEARDMAHEDLIRAEWMTVRAPAQAGRVIHLPSVVCTRSPSTRTAYESLCFFCACSRAFRRRCISLRTFRGA